MKKNLCPCCGKADCFRIEKNNFVAIYGQKSVVAKFNTRKCEKCGSVFDEDESSDELRKRAFLQARQESVCDSLRILEKKLSFTELEHCFTLAPKTLSKWKNKVKSPSAAAAALINLIKVFPWLSYIGMTNYNPAEAYKIAYAAVLQKAKENPNNFAFPFSDDLYEGIALVHKKNEKYIANLIQSPENSYTEHMTSSTISYKGV